MTAARIRQRRARPTRREMDPRWTTLAGMTRRAARLSTEIAERIERRSDDPSIAARLHQTRELLGKADRKLRDLVSEREGRGRPPDARLTCEEVAEIFQVTRGTVRMWTHLGLLRAQRSNRWTTRGSRRVNVYEPYQLMQLSRRSIRTRRPRDPMVRPSSNASTPRTIPRRPIDRSRCGCSETGSPPPSRRSRSRRPPTRAVRRKRPPGSRTAPQAQHPRRSR